MATFPLKVVASNKVFYDGPCSFLVIPLIDGEKGILPGHESTVMAISSGEMRITDDKDSVLEAFVGSGYIELIDGCATVIVISAELPEDIDEHRANQAKERAEEELRQEQSIKEYYHSQANLARAMDRLKIKNKHSHIK